MTKKEIAEFVLKNRQCSEKQFARKFNKAYEELQNIVFPEHFSFRQKLYHWIHNDMDLNLGLCPVCGKRCSFESLNYGYKHHCSKSCSTLDFNVKQKRQMTCLKKWGVTHESKSSLIKYKKEQTCYKHFGVKYPQQCPDVQNTLKRNNIKKYGVPYVTQAEAIKEKIKNTCLEKYGVPYGCMTDIARKRSNDSKPNLFFAELLDKNDISYEREFSLKMYSYDFKVNDTLIEINPTITHNSNLNVWGGSPKDEKYHLNKSNIAEQNGYGCIHIWDWDDANKIVNMLKTKERLYARNLTMREVPEKECNEFLNLYHLQNTCKGGTIRYGLYNDNLLVMLMTFGKPRYNKNYEYELLRLCSHKDYIIVGGAEKLFKNFIKINNPKSIISYCDNSKFYGEIYKKLKFKIKNVSNPSKHWYNMKTGQHITDNLLRQRGYDQLFKTHYGKGTSNEELMLDAGFLPVCDCGTTTFVYIL